MDHSVLQTRRQARLSHAGLGFGNEQGGCAASGRRIHAGTAKRKRSEGGASKPVAHNPRICGDDVFAVLHEKVERLNQAQRRAADQVSHRWRVWRPAPGFAYADGAAGSAAAESGRGRFEIDCQPNALPFALDFSHGASHRTHHSQSHAGSTPRAFPNRRTTARCRRSK